jgi:hypothetical protein
MLLGAATRLTAALAVREIGARLLPRDSTSVQSENAWNTLQEKQRSDYED